mgnify:CR=1 FL=1
MTIQYLIFHYLKSLKSKNQFSNDTWYNIHILKSDGLISIYVDGVDVTEEEPYNLSNDEDISQYYVSNTEPLIIGNNTSGSTRYTYTLRVHLYSVQHFRLQYVYNVQLYTFYFLKYLSIIKVQLCTCTRTRTAVHVALRKCTCTTTRTVRVHVLYSRRLYVFIIMRIILQYEGTEVLSYFRTFESTKVLSKVRKYESTTYESTKVRKYFRTT